MRIRLRVEGNDFRVTKHRFRRISIAVCGSYNHTFIPSLRNQRGGGERVRRAHFVYASRARVLSVAFTEEFQVRAKGVVECERMKVVYASGKDLGMPSRFPTVTTVNLL